MEARRREAREKRIGFRGRIVGMHEAGQYIRTIANNLGISTKTVLRSEDTDWYGNLPRGRPPRCTTPAQRRDILQAAEADPQTNAVAIRESLHLDVSERTVRRVLHEAGVHHRTPANKEFLTDQHREGRLRFAQQYVDKPEEFWKRVIWTDVKTFSSSSHGRRHCWRRNDTRYSPENVFHVARSGHVTVNIWGSGAFRDMRMRRFFHPSRSLSSKTLLDCQHIVGETVTFPRDVGQSKTPCLLGSGDAPPLRATLS
ncbi:hypothetical protein Pmani_012324 [Petrolisthes manimaculis]|uniref:Transposase Tc1-like domain-containing protein n=1 Tax=Petrolisthes manimaculis TaxID=1843537 RepID=A0AAE1UF69_9EUCA|nr:hypothetical protein Pmani_012324 [Petrolisthes manimaculis]